MISRDIILANRGVERAPRLAKIIFFSIFVVISCVESLEQLVLNLAFSPFLRSYFSRRVLINAAQRWLLSSSCTQEIVAIFKTYRACGNGVNSVVTSMGQVKNPSPRQE